MAVELTDYPDVRAGADRAVASEYSDRPLNLSADQLPDIRRSLFAIDLRLVLDLGVKALPGALLLGGALGLLGKRRYVLASLVGACAAAGLAVAATSRRQGRGDAKDDIRLTRYGLKAQRGDYGKLEVIPFK